MLATCAQVLCRRARACGKQSAVSLRCTIQDSKQTVTGHGATGIAEDKSQPQVDQSQS
jgi:hypothetical protein